jgi:uncharacterized protein (TIGR02996 family)
VHPLESQLLAQVLAAPDEDVPRLVYADWLTDQGDPRGDFIHKQIRLAHTDEADPNYSTLYAETERAWLRHSQAWTPRVDPWSPAVVRRARRGFLEEVSLRLTGKKPVAPLPELARSAPLRAARLEIEDLTWSEILWSLEGVKLQELHLSRPFSSYRDEEPTVGALSRLTTLGLACDTFYSNPEGALLKLLEGAQLRALSIVGNELRDADLQPFVAAGLLDSLEHLDLSHTLIGPELLYPLLARLRPKRLGLSSFFALPGQLERQLAWPLETLHLEGNAPTGLLSSPHLTGLRHLSLAAEPLAAYAQQAGALPFSRLTRLRLWRRDERSPCFGVLGRMPALRSLRRLDLRGPWPSQELRALLSSPHLRGLVELSFRGLDDEDAKALARWPGLPHLCRLSLPWPRLEEAGVRALVEARHFTPVHLELKLPAKDKRLREMLRERFGEALKG